MRIPLKIRWEEEGSLEFRSAIGSTKLSIMDIISVEEALRYSWYPFIKVRCARGTINLLGPLTWVDELLDRVLAINLAVEVRFFG